MKKGVLGILLILLILVNLAFLQAQTTIADETAKVNKAYSCLEDKVEGKCSSLSTEEKAFSLLALGECETALVSDSQNSGECWPSGDCEIKTTAQAILALDNVNAQTSKAQNWLLSQNKSPTELIWYLQIESDEATKCEIGYGGSQYEINIWEDKTIDNDAGPCLMLAQDNYWLQVTPSQKCYDYTFSISCNQKFLTTLLFSKSTSSTIHVLPDTHSAQDEGTTTEKVESSCFAENDFCDYEGTLWAAFILNALKEDVSSYLPYLITFAEDNSKYLPDAFLYFITLDDNFKTSLLSKQRSNKWWSESGDKYYDTALALYPFFGETFAVKTSAEEWLLESQDTDGCWQDNIVDTAFILASIWPKQILGGGNGGLEDCDDKGYYCGTKGSCELQKGKVLDYYCPGAFSECCSTQFTTPTCAEQDGEICASGQTCSGSWVSASNTIGRTCCIDGVCTTQEVTKSECEKAKGICRTSECSSDDDEETSNYLCDDAQDFCCVKKTSPTIDYTWIWILLILIVLVVLGIVFRDKLRDFWFKMKSGKGKSPGPRPGPGYRGPPSYPPHYPRPTRPFPERRILLPQSHKQPARPVRSAASKELDDVLKKLKNMGK